MPKTSWPYLKTLYVDGVRNLSAQNLELSPAINCFVGPNGSGKTSLLESLSLLSTGRSFRAASVKPLIQHGEDNCLVRGQLDTKGQEHRLGIKRSRSGDVLLRVDGASVTSLAEFARWMPTVVVDPESTDLVTGPPENRRRLVDGILFHVEQGFFAVWRRYQRALQQRNAALRRGIIADEDPWLPELTSAGDWITEKRRLWVDPLSREMQRQLAVLSPQLPSVELQLRTGWPDDESLASALSRALASDKEGGFTRSGPHRAELRITAEGKPVAEVFSRGQLKLLTLALRFAQGALIAGASGISPIYLVDDVAAELDLQHTQRVFGVLGALKGQVMLTSVAEGLEDSIKGHAPLELFHVEQGRVLPAK